MNRVGSTCKDSYSIDVVLRHQSVTREAISEALLLEPNTSQTKAFYARLVEGNKSTEYEVALRKVVLFIQSHVTFWKEFIGSGGEVELVLNHTICAMDEVGDKCFELELYPEFLEQIYSSGFALRIQGWQGDSQQESAPK